MKEKEIKHNKHMNNKNEEVFITTIKSYTFSNFFCIWYAKHCFLKKYRSSESNFIFILRTDWAYFLRCLAPRPKKITWFQLITLSETYFVCNFSFLRNWSTQSKSRNFCLFQNSLIVLLTAKGSGFIIKKSVL